jgi:hypothetical protein
MPYVGGETPKLGDYVKNQYEQPGTVIRLHSAQDGPDYISVRWDDGAVEAPLASAEGFTLISRAA